MFEGLLEKILLAKLGRYIIGLQKETLKVALWNGDIILENVYLRPDALLSLQIPFAISLGKIKKLGIRIPWSKLSSSPVEITLEGLSLVVTPQEKSEWHFSESGAIFRAKEHIEAHETRLAKKTESQEESKKQKTFIQKLTAKIVDNLRIVIQNIHIRIEYENDRRFTAGFLLNRIECFTANQNGERDFTDRAAAEGLIYKVLAINGLALYWNTNDRTFISKETEELAQLEFMENMAENKEFVVSPINAEARITHRLESQSDPLYVISFDIPEFAMNYHQWQFHDTVRLFEYLTEYNKFLLKAEGVKRFRAFMPSARTPSNLWKFAIGTIIKTIRQRKDRSRDWFAIPKHRFEKTFKMLRLKMKKEEDITEEEVKEYENILFVCDISDILKWTEHVYYVVETPKPGGWFSFWKPKQETYDDIFKGFESGQTLVVPSSYVWLEFSFNLAQGNILLTSPEWGSLEVHYSGFMVSLSKRMEGMDAIAMIQDFSLVSGNGNVICRKIETSQVLPLWRVDIRLMPFEIDADAALSFSSQPIELSLNKQVLSQVVGFFVVPDIDESAKVAAWDTLQGIQDTTQETLIDFLYGESQYLIKIDICGPQLLVESSTEQGIFILNLGHISLKNWANQSEIYEEYQLSVDRINLSFLSFDKIYIIPDLSIDSKLSFMKSKHRQLKWDKKSVDLRAFPDLMISGNLPAINVKFSPSIYNQLRRLKEVFQLEDMTGITYDKKTIYKYALKSGPVLKQGVGVHSWNNYQAVLSGSYVYFFESDESEFAATYFYIKDCSIVNVSEEMSCPWALKLSNRYGNCIFSLESEHELDLWMQSLTEKVSELESYASAALSSSKFNLKDAKWMNLSIDIEAVNLTLCNEEGVDLTLIQFAHISSVLESRAFDMSLKSTMISFDVSDLNRKSEHFSKLISSQKDISVIEMEIQWIHEQSPLFSNSDLNMMIKFGALEFNWNSDQLTSILNFFQFASYSAPLQQSVKSSGGILPNHVLLSLKLKLVKLDLYLNIVENEMLLAKVTFTDFDSIMSIMNGGYEWNCEIGNIGIYDLTNYPKTKSNKGIAPFRLFTGRKSSVLKFHIFMFNKENPEKPPEVGSIVDMELNSVLIVYIHQPIMRIIDFFNYKILGLFDVKARVRDANHWSPIYKLSYLLNLSTIQTLKTMGTVSEERSFTRINIVLDSPNIILTPRPDYREFWTMDLGVIRVSNFPSTTDRRHPSQLVWLDVFNINMHNISIESNNRKIAENFNIDLRLERPVLAPGQQQVDKKYIITGSLEMLKLNFSQQDFTLLLKLSHLNFSYDDKLSHLFSQSPPISESKDPSRGGVFISFNLDLEMVSLLLLKDSKPISELFWGSSLLSITKYNDYSMDVKCNSVVLLGLINDVNEQMFSLPIECMFTLQNYDPEAMRLRQVLFGPSISHIDEEVAEVVSVFSLDMRNNWDGSKDILIDLNSLRVNLHSCAFQEIQNFFFYGIPDYSDETETPYDYLLVEFPTYENISQSYSAPRMSVNVTITSPVFVMPCSDSQRVLVGQSDITFTYCREKEANCYDGEPSVIKRCIAHELEVYSCSLEELSSRAKFQAIRKNRLLEPVQLICESSETKYSISESTYNVYYHTGPFKVILSYKDILLIKKTMEFQQAIRNEEPQSEDEIEDEIKIYETKKSLELKHKFDSPESSFDDELDENTSVMINKTYEINSPFKRALTMGKTCQTSYHYAIDEASVLLVNDAQGAYSLLLDCNLKDFSGMGILNDSNWSFNCKMLVQVNFYNPIVNHWEPLIEKHQFFVEVFDCPENNPEQEIIIKGGEDPPLNINCSEVMLKYFFKITESWKYIDGGEPDDSRDLVSPLSILNNVGCLIVVDQVKEALFIHPGESADYFVKLSVVRGTDMSQETVSLCLCIDSGKSAHIPNIPVHKVQNLVYYINIHGENVPINIGLEMLDAKKLLRISSAITFKNATQVPLYILLKNETNSEEILCEKETFIPPMYYNKQVAFRIEDNTSKLFKIIDDFQEKTEILIGDVFLVMQYKKTRQSMRMYINSPIVLKNRMPVSFHILLFFDSSTAAQDYIIESGEDKNEHSVSMNSAISVCFFLKGFSGSQRQVLLSKRGKNLSSITVYDSKKTPLNVEIFYRQDGTHEFVFYSATALINNSEMPLTFFYKQSDDFKQVPGQTYKSPIVPCSNTKRVAVGLGHKRSDPFKVSTVGAQNIVQFTGEPNPLEMQVCYQFFYDVQLTQVLPDELLFTRVITVSPRFILLNELVNDLMLKQAGSKALDILLPSKTRTSYHWPDYSQRDPMVIIKEKREDEWAWSGPFSISNLGTFTVQCRNADGLYRLIRIEVKLIGNSVFVVFEEEDEKHCLYRIRNNSNHILLECHQSGFSHESRWVYCNTSCAFGWSQPQGKHYLTAKMHYKNQDTGYKYKFPFDKINQSYRIHMREQRMTVFAYVYIEGSSKVIEFRDTRTKEVNLEYVLNHYTVSIPKWGVSILDYVKGRASEVFYVSFTNTTLQARKLKRLWQVDLVIDYFQIDNQSLPNPIFPVLIFPDTETSVLQFSISVYWGFGRNVYNFEFCEVLLQSLCLKLESSVVLRTLGIIGRLFLEDKPVYLSTEMFSMFNEPTWRYSALYKSGKSFYIGKLKLCPMKLMCTFIPTPENEEEFSNDSFSKVTSALGMAFIEIDDAALKLCSVEFTDLSGSQLQVLGALWMNYKSQITSEVLTLIGHAVVLGNPVGLFNNLGTGVFDFFYEPAQGMIDGPASAGRGFIKGTKSLVANTVKGTFGTVSKLTSTLANGITMLTQTKDYNRQRQREFAKNKPKNLVAGIEMGFRSLFNNIGRGITGVVKDPMEGYRRDKVMGLIAGGASGVSGLFVKPVAGVLDAASMAAEGIKSSAKGDDVEQASRQRFPRTLYGAYGILKLYSQDDAQVWHFLSCLKKGRFASEKFVGQCVFEDFKKTVWVLGVFLRLIVLAEAARGKVKWMVDNHSITMYEERDQGILIYTRPNKYKKTKNKTTFLVPIADNKLVQKMIKKIKYAVDNHANDINLD